MRRKIVSRALLVGAAALLLLAAAAVLSLTRDDSAEAETVRFQRPASPGPQPFTPAADLGAGPFGGSGSSYRCDPELLIRSLDARPDREQAWAEVLGIDQSQVASYIEQLRPMTLSQDTRVTNHSYSGGQAQPFQSIIQAGTAVLADDKGQPVVRCRCGNPLLAPKDDKVGSCLHCPPRYTPPPACKYGYDKYGRCYQPCEYGFDQYGRCRNCKYGYDEYGRCNRPPTETTDTETTPTETVPPPTESAPPPLTLPEQPGVTPQEPGVTPQQPGVPPEQPGAPPSPEGSTASPSE